MQTKLLRNIDIVQINITAGQDEYYLPKNVDWSTRVIDRIALVAPTANITSPIDGTTHVLKRSEISSMYVDLYGNDGKDLAHELSYEQLLHTNNNPYLINAKINLDLSRIYFTDTPQVSGCILLYVYYNGVNRPEVEQSRKSITVRFPLAASEKLTFTDLVNTYMYASGYKVKGIQVWDAENKPAYITLRDHELTYIMNNVYSGLFRPQIAGLTAESVQATPAVFDSLNIDFDYSFIRNATNGAVVQKITFEY